MIGMREVAYGSAYKTVMKKGEDILKYGDVIGVAVRDIALGEHVHIHNLEGKIEEGNIGVKADER